MLPKSNQKGLTFIELILACTIILILLTTILLLANPVFFRAKSRDQKRLSDLQLLERVIIEYKVDHNSYPDTSGALRASTILPPSRTSLSNPRSGWIAVDLIEYTTKLPVDPINNDTYHYSYIRTNDVYELDARLEVLTNEMANDHGNDPNMYELGTDKTLITP